jgi:hypothetical protein
MYQKSFQKFEKAMDDTEEINRIKKKFQTKKVKIIKYNFQNGFIVQASSSSWFSKDTKILSL